MKRFSDAELASLAAALAMIGGLEPGDVGLAEHDDGTLTAFFLGEELGTGSLEYVVQLVAQAVWRFAYDRDHAASLDPEAQDTREAFESPSCG